ncbi:hypothetical protein GCM10011506_30580 [Marivirga lumbricoides]|uniref:Tetratricopeptide repeat protein n=1 Tax=Marivirga lumbricoides TaxID=1046115 RepID=A0ABQ1MLZ0_9BACT|nr:hypothetical protein GCM10011506_30580 [Marivirga lumbricoides]
MKKTVLTFAILIIVVTSSIAEIINPYEKAMKAQLALLDSAQTIQEYQAVANSFERIAQKESNEWLPLYYAAYSYINIGFDKSLTLDQKDTYFNKAEELLKKAETLSANNSEITALRGYAVMAKLAADPASRGQSLSPVAMQLFGKAIQQNGKNPRALYLMAQMEYGMAQFFGSGTEKACSMAKKSVFLYENESIEGINPYWGAEMAKEMTTKCK